MVGSEIGIRNGCEARESRFDVKQGAGKVLRIGDRIGLAEALDLNDIVNDGVSRDKPPLPRVGRDLRHLSQRVVHGQGEELARGVGQRDGWLLVTSAAPDAPLI